jgi:hypothetical protein
VALVPKGPSDFELYYRGYSRSQQRRIEVQFRQDELQEERYARVHQKRQCNRVKHAQLAATGLTYLREDLQRKIEDHDSPQLEDALEGLWSDAVASTRQHFRRAYGDG